MKMARFIAALCVVAGLAAAVPAEDINLIPNRLSFAKVGEWASYKLPSGYIQKLTVSKRSGEGSDALVTVLVENIYDGNLVEAKEITENAGDAFTSPRVPTDPGVFVAVRNETVSYKGKNYVVSIVEFNRDLGTEDQDVTEWWSNSEIPVFGIVKKVENGEIAWELSDWGYSDGRAKKIVYEDGQFKVVNAEPVAADKAAGAGESIAEKAAKAAKSVGNAAVKAKDAVAEKASVAAGAVADKSSDAVKATGEALGRAGHAVAEKTANARATVGEAAADARDAAKETAVGAARVAEDAFDGAKSAAGRAAGVVADKASDAGEAIGNAYDSAKARITSDSKADEAAETAVESLRPPEN